MKISLLLLPWFGVVFFTLGLFINFLQLCVLPIYWIHRDTYQILTTKLAYNLYSVVTFLGDWWGNIDLHMYGEEKDIRMIAKEKSLVVLNHCGDVDWLVCWVFAERLNFLERTNCFIKEVVKYIPTFGWCWWFAGWGFLKRNWKTDQTGMIKHIQDCKKNNTNYSITLFCEGTRQTEDKLKASQEYAIKNGKEPLKHHLLPRTKGFSVIANGLRDHVTGLFDGELAFPYPESATIAHLLNRETVEVHIHLRRIPMSEVPCATEEQASNYCSQIYKEKDDLMEHYVEHKVFPGKKVELSRPSRNLCTFLFHNIWIGALYMLIVNYFVGVYGFNVVAMFLIMLTSIVLVSLRVLMRVTEVKKGSSFGLHNNNHVKKGQ